MTHPVDDSDPAISQLARWLTESGNTVVFTGAGISTESGIPDFRSPGGFWANSQPVMFDDFLQSDAARYEYWRQKAASHVEFSKAEPNFGHRILADWEAAGRIRGVITQNIDGLHQLAGSRTVWELHGTARNVSCLDCGDTSPADEWVESFLNTDRVPECGQCGGRLKHATISFGQQLPTDVLDAAAAAAGECELMLALGSSLVVYPAAGLPELAADRGARLAIINREPTPLDGAAALCINAPLGETLAAIDAVFAE